MDSVDNSEEIRDFTGVLLGKTVDNPVDTVDESTLWLCIMPFYEHA